MTKDKLLGYELPMPLSDLYTALITVALFLPAVVCINYIVNRGISLVTKKKRA